MRIPGCTFSRSERMKKNIYIYIFINENNWIGFLEFCKFTNILSQKAINTVYYLEATWYDKHIKSHKLHYLSNFMIGMFRYVWESSNIIYDMYWCSARNQGLSQFLWGLSTLIFTVVRYLVREKFNVEVNLCCNYNHQCLW